MTDLFLSDLRSFGRDRAFTRLEHRDKVREFRWRQYQLAGTGAMFVLFYMFCGVSLFAILAAVCFTTARDECRRMRAVGRHWQTKRSVEVIGI